MHLLVEITQAPPKAPTERVRKSLGSLPAGPLRQIQHKTQPKSKWYYLHHEAKPREKPIQNSWYYLNK
ncbi:unnamed protein product [Cuscuta campestris]|uniref:Uncharacterized protein n=1 Tax=Cuscuta campestris TaxID=132261 RepID=A0A484MV49_9ASTE|nr:unnamed protein product [Cuscuta campestris]